MVLLKGLCKVIVYMKGHIKTFPQPRDQIKSETIAGEEEYEECLMLKCKCRWLGAVCMNTVFITNISEVVLECKKRAQRLDSKTIS